MVQMPLPLDPPSPRRSRPSCTSSRQGRQSRGSRARCALKVRISSARAVMSRLMTLLRGSLPRAFIACATVLVATLAALAAYNTALKEQDAAVTERLLVQAQLLEIADLTHSVNTANLRLELGSRIQGDFERGTKAHVTRDWLRSQEEFAAAGVLLAVPGAPEQWAEIDAIPSSFEPEFSRALTALGFTPGIVSPEEARRGRTALGPLVQEVRTIDRQVVELSIGALFLVLTLCPVDLRRSVAACRPAVARCFHDRVHYGSGPNSRGRSGRCHATRLRCSGAGRIGLRSLAYACAG